ncbi:MAG: DUF2325 domain-containing protein [Desulfobacteraceae bacterium]
MCMLHNVSQGNDQHNAVHEIKGMTSDQMLSTKTMKSLPDFSLSVEAQTEAVPFKLWEIDHVFRCPVVGICLDHAEQKQLLKKSGIMFKDKTPYEIHEILVAGAESDNRLSQRVNRLLHRKFGRKASELYGLSETDFMRCWKTAFDSGDYLAELWAAVTRRDLDESSRKDIFGAIHMVMHNQAESFARMTKQVTRADERTKEQETKIKDLLVSRRTLVKENESLKRLLDQAKKPMRSGETGLNRTSFEQPGHDRVCRISELELENKRLNQIVIDQAETLKFKEQKLSSLIMQLTNLSDEREEWKQAEWRFRKEAEQTMNSFSSLNRCEEDCPAFDLCSKRVLIVGGIERMEALYRQVIERSGGIFEYHAGHMKGGGKTLENRLKRSDIVLCPVNCNSHAACAMVKNLGKKHNKPVHMLSSFSLSTVSQVIKTCGAVQAA